MGPDRQLGSIYNSLVPRPFQSRIRCRACVGILNVFYVGHSASYGSLQAAAVFLQDSRRENFGKKNSEKAEVRVDR